MPVIALISPKGGVGKTTLTANLASILGSTQPDLQRVLAVDLDPQNALRFHHRMHPRDHRGLVPAALDGASLKDAIYQGPFRVDCLPYGVTTDLQRHSFESKLAQEPKWFGQALRKTDRDCILIDTPPGPTLYARAAFSVADIILVVLLADAASYAALESMNRYIDDYCPPGAPRPELHFIVNQVDHAKLLGRDVLGVMQQTVSRQDKLWQVHYDTAVEEALACHQPLGAYQPGSVAAKDLGEIAEWLKTR